MGYGGPSLMPLCPDRETYWSKIRKWIVRNWQILIVSVNNVCKLLQLVVDFCPRPHGLIDPQK